MKKTRILLIMTALIVCMSGQSFAAEEPEAGSAADNGAVNAAPAQTEAEAKAQAGNEPVASATGAQTETQAVEQTETKTDSQTPAQAVPKQDAKPEKREVRVYRSCVITWIDSREGRILVNWKRRSSGEGYCVYRREEGQEKWTRVARFSDNTKLQYRDSDIENGAVYEYKVLKYNTIVTDEESVPYSKPANIGNTKAAGYTYLEAPEDLKYTKKENSISLRWKKNPFAEEYIVMYSRNSLFRNARTLRTYDTRCELKGLNTSKRWYMSVRCVKETYHSDWARSSNYSAQRTAAISYVKVYRKVKKNG
ncbi:MAG: hypothetical protein IIY39_00470, partial [Firmicutes bacterium]|nr:hypothetical protein [Bacillota bacterium]